MVEGLMPFTTCLMMYRPIGLSGANEKADLLDA